MKDEHTKQTIANINYHFFARSETFIYNNLIHCQKVHPICLSLYEPITNIDLFPFPGDDLYAYKPKQECRGAKRWTVQWLKLGIRKHVLSRMWLNAETEIIMWASSILGQRKASVIHAHFGPIGYQMLPLKRKLGLPMVTTFYGFDTANLTPLEPMNWPEHRQQLFNEGELFLVEGPFMRQRLINLGCPANKIILQRILIDLNATPYRKREFKLERKVIIVFAGRFCEKKGLMYALKAVLKLSQLGMNIEFRMIGGGELERDVANFITDNNMKEIAIILGVLDYKSYIKEMDSGDIFLHPSITADDGDSEGGAPTTILEAQALGMPVVSTTHADIPNVTVPGQSAILVGERDVNALVTALCKVISPSADWEKMGKTGRSFIEKHHEVNQGILSLERIYASMQIFKKKMDCNRPDLFAQSLGFAGNRNLCHK